MTERLITHEVGSLAKPEWRVKMTSGSKITEKDLKNAVEWGERLGIDYSPLIEILVKEKISPEEKEKVHDFAALYAIRLQEKAGLDVIYDGEQDRTEMYEHAVAHSHGFKFRGLVRAFDNKYYKKGAVVGLPTITNPWHTEELLRLQELTEKKIKVPITGAYTIAAWSFDEYYATQSEIGTSQGLKENSKAREKLVLDIARNLIRPNLEDLIKKGATWIQIDEPAATTIPSEVPLFVEAFNESVRGLTGAEFSVHICYSNYELLFPHITKMENCAQYSLELANRDSKELGTKEGDRPAYEILKRFKEFKIPSRIGLGVVDIHSDFLETPELVRDRILYSAKVLGDSKLINPSSDCGLRTRSWDVSFKKLEAVAKGAILAQIELNKENNSK